MSDERKNFSIRAFAYRSLKSHKPSGADVLWFVLLPIQLRDFTRIADQFSVLWRFFCQSYKALALLPDDYSSRGFLSDLTAATKNWRIQWGGLLRKGWRDGDGEGLDGRVGGLGLALFSQKNIVRDTTAIAYGWTLFVTFWVVLAYVILHLAVGVAHAQSVGSSAGSAASADLARQAMGTVFPFWGASTPLSQAMGQIAAILTKLNLSFAGIGIIWSAVVMFLEIGGSWEKAKDRYNLLMFVVRSALCVAMLAPLPSGNGYNVAQGLVAGFAMKGSDQASTAWGNMVGSLTCSSVQNAGLGSSSSSGSAGTTCAGTPVISEFEIEQTVAAIAKNEACAAAISDDPVRSQNETVTFNGSTNWFQDNTGQWDHYLTGFTMTKLDVPAGCGSVTFPSASSTGTQAVSSSAISSIRTAQATAFSAARSSIQSYMQSAMQNGVNCRDSADSSTCNAQPTGDSFATVVQTYRTSLTSAISSAVSSANSSASQQLSTASTQQGWIAAGAFGVTLSEMQSSLDGAASTFPRLTGPNMPDIGLANDLSQKYVGASTTTGQTPLGAAQMAMSAGNTGSRDTLFKSVMSGGGTLVLMPQINSMTPLAGISALGRSTYETVEAMWVVIKAFELVSSTVSKVAPEASLFLNIGSAVVDTIKPVLMPLWIVGVALAYLVPSLPFIRFFFGVLGWMIAFVETVFLVNAGLLQMISPEPGGGMFGPARAVIWNVVDLALRPILTLAGFIAGLSVLSAAIGLLNTVWLPMMLANENASGNGNWTGGWTVVGFLAYLSIYLVLTYVIVNSCSKLAEILPNAAYRWMGANGSGERDDASAISGVLGGTISRLSFGGPRPKGNAK